MSGSDRNTDLRRRHQPARGPWAAIRFGFLQNSGNAKGASDCDRGFRLRGFISAERQAEEAWLICLSSFGLASLVRWHQKLDSLSYCVCGRRVPRVASEIDGDDGLVSVGRADHLPRLKLLETRREIGHVAAGDIIPKSLAVDPGLYDEKYGRLDINDARNLRYFCDGCVVKKARRRVSVWGARTRRPVTAVAPRERGPIESTANALSVD